MEIVMFLVRSLIFAVAFWTSVRVVSGGDERNTPVFAGVVGLVFGGIASVLPIFFFAMPLIALLLLLIRYFDFGIIKSFIVVFLIGAIHVGTAIAAGALLHTVGH